MFVVVIWSAIQNRKQPVKRVRAIVRRRRLRDDSLDVPSNPFYMALNVLRWGPGRKATGMSSDQVGRLSGDKTVYSEYTDQTLRPPNRTTVERVRGADREMRSAECAI